MADVIMKGSAAAAAMKDELIKEREAMNAVGVEPCLAIVRIGEKQDDIAYESGAVKRMESVGIKVKKFELPADIQQNELKSKFRSINEDPEVNGILLLRPLPGDLDDKPLTLMIDPIKDVDSMSPVNSAKVFAADETGYAPCTSEAVIELLDHNGIELKGKRVTLIGRSMVVGKPLAMLLLARNATVTICHTRTKSLADECRRAEIVVAAAGNANMLHGDMISPGTIVVDVGINADKDGNICGDVDFAGVEPKASMISPVPGGVGSVTTSVLAKHVLKAARAMNANSWNKLK